MRNSAWMEHEGLVRAVNVISDARLKIAQLITDRHKQNTAWIKRQLPLFPRVKMAFFFNKP